MSYVPVSFISIFVELKPSSLLAIRAEDWTMNRAMVTASELLWLAAQYIHKINVLTRMPGHGQLRIFGGIDHFGV